MEKIEIEKNIESIEQIDDLDQLTALIGDLLRSLIEYDKVSMLIGKADEQIYYQLFEGIWKELDHLPASLSQKVIESGKAKVYNELAEETIYNSQIDTMGDETSALLLYPVADETVSGVLAIWKSKEKEKEQVMMPLIVGSKMIGMTAQVRSREILKEFSKSDVETLKQIEELLKKVFEKILISISDQRNALINDVVESEAFKTPAEIIASLINMLVGIKGSVENIEEAIKIIKKETHRDEKLFSEINLIETIVKNTQNNVTNALRFTSDSFMVNALSEGMNLVETDKYFKDLFLPCVTIACENGTKSLFYIDPSLPVRISLQQRILYAFFISLVNYTFKNEKSLENFEVIVNQIDNAKIEIKIKYTKREHAFSDIGDFHSALSNHSSDENYELYTSYRQLLSVGGNVELFYSEKYKKFNISIKLPVKVEERSPIVSRNEYQNVGVSILLDRNHDYASANIMARYLLALGLKKDQVVGMQNINTLPSHTTHLIIFESKLTDELIRSIKEKNLHIMILKDGCVSENTHQIYDFSAIDAQMKKTDFYLFELKDFLAL